MVKFCLKKENLIEFLPETYKITKNINFNSNLESKFLLTWNSFKHLKIMTPFNLITPQKKRSFHYFLCHQTYSKNHRKQFPSILDLNFQSNFNLIFPQFSFIQCKPSTLESLRNLTKIKVTQISSCVARIIIIIIIIMTNKEKKSTFVW